MRRALILGLMLTGCGGTEDLEAEAEAETWATSEQALVTCNYHQDTGYRSGTPFTLTLVTVDGMPVEVGTANAFSVMQDAAARSGVNLRVNDGFRTPQEQQYYYSCYVNCNCNSCNTAAAPGYSNHQSGRALDLNTSVGGVYDWLAANGGAYGFARTVPSERWHWEYMGGSPGTGPCVPSCDRSAGPFTFSCDGPQANQHCVNVNEPSDPDSWGDNYFCSTRDLGLKWSFTGPLEGLDCTAVNESAEAQAQAWSDNALCVPKQSPWKLSFSSAGPIAGRDCVQWNEPSDPHSWGDNFLCSERNFDFSAGGFTFSMNGARAGKSCVAVDEPSDPDTWNDNFFCSDVALGMRWSHAGPIEGMTCTNVAESAESHPEIWADNYLCLPRSAPWRFSWSSAGAPAGKTCVRWFDHSETNASWLDNWLCVEPIAPLVDAKGDPFFLVSEVPVEAAPPEVPAEAEVSAVHLQSMGCSTAPALEFGLLAALAWLRRRRIVIARRAPPLEAAWQGALSLREIPARPERVD